MCKWGTHEKVRVKIPADLNYVGKERWKDVGIDKCIASLVKALQMSGIDMCGSCCGHGKRLGVIHLQDERALVIFNTFGLYDKHSKDINEIISVA